MLWWEVMKLIKMLGRWVFLVIFMFFVIWLIIIFVFFLLDMFRWGLLLFWFLMKNLGCKVLLILWYRVVIFISRWFVLMVWVVFFDKLVIWRECWRVFGVLLVNCWSNGWFILDNFISEIDEVKLKNCFSNGMSG